jgi:hypothetical protein
LSSANGERLPREGARTKQGTRDDVRRGAGNDVRPAVDVRKTIRERTAVKSNVGVWIDHRKAFIVRLHDDAEETHSIVSDVGKHVRYSGGKPEDQIDNRFTNQLNEYYAKVISFLGDAGAVLILGPGEAKGELSKRLSVEPSGPRIDSIETADKMTDNQITARVRDHFLAPAERAQQGEHQ